MFVRAKKSGAYQYLQVVENQRIDGQVRQRVVATLGRLDILQATGKIDAILSSCARFAERVSVLDAHKHGSLQPAETIKIGPPKVFGRLWEQTMIDKVIKKLLQGRKYEFDVERAIFLTVLHRLMVSGSDRDAEQWSRGYAIDRINDIELHHIYRAMAWLGQELSADSQFGATPFAPRCTKDLIEESLFAQRRDLFSGLDLVFFDTTSIYFEGQGGETIGQYGNSKDHRPDLKQMVVGAVLDGKGHPICCELWPGNTADVKTLVPVVDRLKSKFGIGRVCIVADRGMISKETITQLQKSVRDVRYILGARMRLVKEIREVALHYKELWMVEAIFRTIKSILANRPIFHKCDETIRGHVFCSFLALILAKELQSRMAERGWIVEWERLKNDLDRVEEITVRTGTQAFIIRSETRGDAGKAIQAAAVALGPVIRPLNEAK